MSSPVFWLIVSVMPFDVYAGFQQLKLDWDTQKFGVFAPELNSPSANNSETIIAMTNIAHP